MRLLLDSHIVIWALTVPEKLSLNCRQAIEDGNNDVYVSAATIWELRLKAAKGKLTLPSDFESSLSETGFTEIPVKWTHAVECADLPMIHSDPFDRMLLAQSMLEDMILVTRDAMILKYDAAMMRG